MTTVAVTVYECYGAYEEDVEEACWGPYPTNGDLTFAKPFDQLEPSDFMLEGWTPEDVVYDENFLMWDTTQDLKDEPNQYVRFNYLAREVRS